MVLAQIGSTDITQYINESSYKVNSVPVEYSWVDANHVSHTDEVRRRIEGTFELAFTNDTDYGNFLTLLNSAKSGNLLTIKVYVGGDVNALETIVCTYRMDTKFRRQASSGYIVTIMTMNIKQR